MSRDHSHDYSPTLFLGISGPMHFAREVCRIIVEKDRRYMYYAVLEYPEWMSGEYSDWYKNYRGEDDFLPGLAMAICAFYCGLEDIQLTASELAKDYLARHYRERQFLPDIYVLSILMCHGRFAKMITPDPEKRHRVLGYCVREVYDYERRCFRFPTSDADIIFKVFPLSDDFYPNCYKKYVIDAEPFGEEEVREIRAMLSI